MVELQELDHLRRAGTRALAAVIWGFLAVIAAGCCLNGGDWGLLGLGLVLAILPTVCAISSRSDGGTCVMFGVTLPLYPGLLLVQWAGSPWQIDIHMLFFAVLAMLAVLGNWRTIVAGTLVTAVHHLGADLLLPAWVFPDGANLPRVMLHAVIVLIEAGVLIQLVVRLERTIIGQARSRAAAEASEQAAAAVRAATAAEQATVLAAVGGGLKSLSCGNLTYRLRDAFPEGYEGLKQDFNQALQSLEAALAKVAAATGGINSGAGNIRQASDDLALRTERQAASLEETAAAMDEITATVRTTAAAAGQANGAITHMRTDVEHGGEIVGRAIDAMTRIEQSSTSIAEIITVIDGIAFQTNLLALNAGVEAARAGDAGKGFAVVASEVRALAQRSADAARDVNAIITASAREVGTGVELVKETGSALQRVILGMGKVSTLVSSVSASAEHQAEGLQQINIAIGEMDSVTQQNAAMVEEATAAAQSLASDADDLAQQVNHFQVGSSDKEPVRGSRRDHTQMPTLRLLAS